MKKLLVMSMMALLVLSIMPGILAAHIGTGVGIDIETEDFAPKVWMCNNRVVYDDPWQPGTTSGDKLIEREQNYAFMGESIEWKVLVMDKNGFEKISDVYATIGDSQGDGNDIEVNCVFEYVLSSADSIDDACNARIGQADLEDIFSKRTAAYYTCRLHVEPDWYGEYWITVEAEDLDGLLGTMDENEFWYMNPVIALSIDGDLVFEEVRPGTTSYSDTILVGNDADDGSGVRLEMFISGTDFFDSESSGAMCPTSNVLKLNSGNTIAGPADGILYFATNGFYSTQNTLGVGPFEVDAEGYHTIPYGDQIGEAKEIIGTEFYKMGTTQIGNVLTPGSEMAVTFKLQLPEPCNGDFDSGSINFWGEAI